MADPIELHREIQFNGRVEHLLQQMGSKLRPWVWEQGFRGKQAEVVRQFGSIEAVEKVDRNAELQIVDVPTDRRWIYPRTYGFRTFEDDVDRLRTNMSSSPYYAQAYAKGLGRAIDRRIIAAATGTAQTGESGETAEAFDTSTVLFTGATGYQIAAGGKSMTVDKLRAARRLFEFAENDLEVDQLCVAISAQEAEALRQETQMISYDYNTNRVLVNGKLEPFMGFNFVHIENLLQTDGTNRSCFAWVKSGLCLGMWNDIRTPTTFDDARQAYQTAGLLDVGATRTQQGKVVNILCAL